MSFNLPGGAAVRVNSTSVSIPVVLRDTSGNVVTAEAFGDMTGSYQRQGAGRTAITMADLATPQIDDVYLSGGFLEVDSTNQKGLYRFDIPDAAFVHGVDWVVISLQSAAIEPLSIAFSLTYDGQVRSFTPQDLASGTLTLDASADAGDGAFLDKTFVVVYSDDATDLGAAMHCHTSYTGSSKVALGTWTRVPTGTVNTMLLVAMADLPFTEMVNDQIDGANVNVESVNTVALQGAGTVGDPWVPA